MTIACAALFLLLSTFHCPPRSESNNTPQNGGYGFGLDDRDVLLYLEAVARIKKEAAFIDADTTRETIIHDTLKAYLLQQDPFADYLTRAELRRLRETQNETYVGIGMEVSRDRQGRLLCIPYPNSAAQHAGITTGDELKRVDGVAVDGKSPLAVATMARGKAGSQLSLVVLTQDGEEKLVRVTRTATVTESVVTLRVEKQPVIKIAFFTRSTKKELQHALRDWRDSAPIVIDLRGNAGGDLHAAIDAAKLFLPPGRRVASLITRTGTKEYESGRSAPHVNSPVYLWQDGETASAAEVFVAALTENGRAVSIGTNTAGKGTRQDIIELSDGSGLVMTTGEVRTPLGHRYHGKGQSPTYELKAERPEQGQYVAKTQELIVRKREHSARPIAQ